MKKFVETLLTIAGILFGVLLLGFTGYETYNFLLGVTHNPLIALIGLIMFEGGFLYWAAEFRSHAEGLLQMAIALLTSIADFLAVVTAVALRLGAVEQTVFGESTAARVVVAAVLVNLAAKYAYGLSHPDNVKNIMKRASEGLIMARTFMAFSEKTEDIAQELADEMAETWRDEMRDDLRYKHKALVHKRPSNALPAVNRPTVIENGVRPRPNLFSRFWRPKQATEQGNGVVRHEVVSPPAPAAQPLTPDNEPKRNHPNV